MDPNDRFEIDGTKDVKDQGRDIVPVTKADSDLTYDKGDGRGAVARTARALLIETGGTLNVMTAVGNIRALTVPTGYLLVEIKQVRTGGTADNISAIF